MGVCSMPAASPLPIPSEDVAELRRWIRSSWLPAVLAQRARILLLAAEGVTNTGIAERVGVSRPTVIACRRRYVRRGLGGLPDRPRPGRDLVGHPQPAPASAGHHPLVDSAPGPRA